MDKLQSGDQFLFENFTGMSLEGLNHLFNLICCISIHLQGSFIK